MKKFIVTTLGLFCAAAIVAQAQEAKPAKKELTAEQKAVMKELTAKYDINKDGKLDKEERAKMSQEDKDKLTKVGLGHKKAATAATASTNAPAIK